jgi:hypothetical protein
MGGAEWRLEQAGSTESLPVARAITRNISDRGAFIRGRGER